MVSVLNIGGLVVVIFGICICSYGFFELLPLIMGWIQNESPVIPLLTIIVGLGFCYTGVRLYWVNS